MSFVFVMSDPNGHLCQTIFRSLLTTTMNHERRRITNKGTGGAKRDSRTDALVAQDGAARTKEAFRKGDIRDQLLRGVSRLLRPQWLEWEYLGR